MVLLALLVRAYPLHVYFLNPDHTFIPEMAVRSFVQQSWRPWLLAYPSGLMYTLRAAYALGYAVGHGTGWFADRLDLLVSFLVDPFPFLLVARVWSALLGTATVLLVMRVASQAFEASGGVLAGLFLALSFLHARESHYGSLDAPATFFFAATVASGVAHARTRRLRDLLLSAIAAGAAAGYRYQAGVVAVVLPLAAVLGRSGRIGADVARLLLAIVVSALTFVVLSPFSVLEFGRARSDVHDQLWLAYTGRGVGLPLGTIFTAGSGWAICGLALVGIAVVVWKRNVAGLLTVAAGLPCLAMLATPKSIYARYALPIFPLIAVLAAGGATALTRLAPRRWRAIVLAGLALAAVADPGLRTLQYVRLLGREDTRVSAARWIHEQLRTGQPVLIPGAQSYGYALPEMPIDANLARLRYGPEISARLLRLVPPHPLPKVGETATQLAAVWAPGRYLMTTEFPVPRFGTVSPSVANALEAGAQVVERFDAFDPSAAASALYEPIDANALPLRGLAAVTRPGPNIKIWRLRTLAPPGVPPAAR